jgi:glucokinase
VATAWRPEPPPAPRHEPRLLGDVGGTHARIGWQAHAGAAIEDVRVYRADHHAGLHSVIARYRSESGRPPAPLVAIGIANPVHGDQVCMTNRDWSFSIEGLRRQLGVRRLVVLNDFEALARALPELAPAELTTVHEGVADPVGTKALLGPGTGLGAAALVRAGERWLPMAGEGGHATLSTVTPRESAVAAALQQRFGHASAERAVSGPGLVWIHDALCDIDRLPRRAGLSPTQVAEDSGDRHCREALQLFFAFLGGTAGNLALTVGARGGIYIGGGIVPRLAGRLAESPFHERLIGKGRFRAWLQALPVFLVQDAGFPALRGAAAALH